MKWAFVNPILASTWFNQWINSLKEWWEENVQPFIESWRRENPWTFDWVGKWTNAVADIESMPWMALSWLERASTNLWQLTDVNTKKSIGENISEKAENLVKTFWGSIETAFNTVLAPATSLFHVAWEVPLVWDAINWWFSLIPNAVDWLMSWKYRNELAKQLWARRMEGASFITDWYNNELDDQGREDLQNAVFLLVAEKVGKSDKIKKLKANSWVFIKTLSEAIWDALQTGRYATSIDLRLKRQQRGWTVLERTEALEWPWTEWQITDRTPVYREGEFREWENTIWDRVEALKTGIQAWVWKFVDNLKAGSEYNKRLEEWLNKVTAEVNTRSVEKETKKEAEDLEKEVKGEININWQLKDLENKLKESEGGQSKGGLSEKIDNYLSQVDETTRTQREDNPYFSSDWRDLIETIDNNPWVNIDEYINNEYESVLNVMKDTLDEIRNELSNQTGKLYETARDVNAPVDISNALTEVKNLLADQGIEWREWWKADFTKSGSISSADQTAIQRVLDRISSWEINNATTAHNLRKMIDSLAKWDKWVSNDWIATIRQIRDKIDEVVKSQIPWMKESDAIYSVDKTTYTNLAKSITVKNAPKWTLRENAVSVVKNLLSPSKKLTLNQWEKALPWLTKKLESIKNLKPLYKAYTSDNVGIIWKIESTTLWNAFKLIGLWTWGFSWLLVWMGIDKIVEKLNWPLKKKAIKEVLSRNSENAISSALDIEKRAEELKNLSKEKREKIVEILQKIKEEWNKKNKTKEEQDAWNEAKEKIDLLQKALKEWTEKAWNNFTNAVKEDFENKSKALPENKQVKNDNRVIVIWKNNKIIVDEKGNAKRGWTISEVDNRSESNKKDWYTDQGNKVIKTGNKVIWKKSISETETAESGVSTREIPWNKVRLTEEITREINKDLDNLSLSVKENKFNPEQFLQAVKEVFKVKNPESNSIYVDIDKESWTYTLRVSSHNAHAYNAKRSWNTENNTSIVIRFDKDGKFKKDKSVNMTEYSYDPDNLTTEKMEGIIKGIKDYIETWEYTDTNYDVKHESKKATTEVEILPENISVEKESQKMGEKRISPDRVVRQQLSFQEGVDNIMDGVQAVKDYIVQSTKRLYWNYWRPEGEWYVGNEEFKNISLKATRTLYKDWKFLSNKSKEFKELWKNIADADGEKSLQEIAKTFYISKVKKDISKGYQYPQEVLGLIPGAKRAVNARQRYEKGLHTSFSANDSRIDYSEKDKIGAGIKSQDGKQVTKEQKENVVKGILDFADALNLDMKQIAEDLELVYVDTHGGNVFLRADAIGMYRQTKDMEGNINNRSVSVWGSETVRRKEKKRNPETREYDETWRTEKVNTTMAHELWHALDFMVENKLVPSEVKSTLKTSFNKKNIDLFGKAYLNYLERPTEIVARMFQQYVAVKKWQTSYYNTLWFRDKDIFDKIVKPEVEKAIEDHFSKYHKSETELKYQRVFHGTGKLFDKFDFSHIGEWEGTQWHWRGMYVAVDRNVGKKYAEMLGKQYKWELITEKSSEAVQRVNVSINELMSYEWYSFNDAVEHLKWERRDYYDDYKVENTNEWKIMAKTYKERLDILEDMSESKWYVYEVEIPDEKKANTPTGINYIEEDSLIERDAMDEFADALEKALGDKADNPQNTKILETWRDKKIKWWELYQWLKESLWGDKEASKFLEDLWYDGIAYYWWEDGWAYVIFNSDNMKITNNKPQKFGYWKGKDVSAEAGLLIKNFLDGRTAKDIALERGFKINILDKIMTPDGVEAYGSYGNQTLNFANMIKEGTAPHELFHAMFDLVDKKEKTAILDGVQKEKSLTKEESEEWLADNFAEYWKSWDLIDDKMPQTREEYIDNRGVDRELFDDIKKEKGFTTDEEVKDYLKKGAKDENFWYNELSEELYNRVISYFEKSKKMIEDLYENREKYKQLFKDMIEWKKSKGTSNEKSNWDTAYQKKRTNKVITTANKVLVW